MHDGQRRAVHGHGEQGVPAVEHDRQRGARGEPVDRGAQQLIGTRQRAGLPDQGGQARAKPAGVTYVRPADRVRDTGERDLGLDQRAPQQVGEGDGHLALDHPVDPQPPARRGDLGHSGRATGKTPSGEQRAEAGEAEVAARRKRRGGYHGPGKLYGGPRRGDVVLVGQVFSG